MQKYNWKDIKDIVVTVNLTTNEVDWPSPVEFPPPQTDYLQSKLDNLYNTIDNISEYENDDYIDLSD